MVHLKVLVPTLILVMVDVGLEGVVIVPEPLIKVQVPVPGDVAAFPASVVDVVGKHNC